MGRRHASRGGNLQCDLLRIDLFGDRCFTLLLGRLNILTINAEFRPFGDQAEKPAPPVDSKGPWPGVGFSFL